MRFSKLAAVVFAVVPAVALACVGTPCSDPWVFTVNDGGSIPSNVPALILTAPVANYGGPDSLDAGITLTRADGGTLDITLANEGNGKVVIIKPVAALPTGETLHLHYPTLCHASNSPLYDLTFTATEPTTLPTSLGTLTITEQGHGPTEVFASAVCAENVPGAYAIFTFKPSAELTPFLAVTELSLLVDGQRWATEQVGAMSAEGTLAPLPSYSHQYVAGPRVLKVYGGCPGAPANVGVSIGTHQVELIGRVMGSAPLSIKTSITLDCQTVIPPVEPPRGCSAAPAALMLWGIVGPLAALRRRRSRLVH